MRYCLIIDDTNQADEISTLELSAKDRAFPIKAYYFNPIKKECLREEKKVGGEVVYVLDKDLLWDELIKAFPSQHLDLIAIDYELSDPFIKGLEIVQFLREKNWKGKTPYVIYSGNSNEIKENLKNSIEGLINNTNELNDFLESYYELNPIKIFNRGNAHDSYVEKLYEFIKKNKSSLNNKLSQKLNQHPERKFRNIFTAGFEGLELKVLSELVLKNTVQSDEFEDEFIDRCVDHFIDLKD